MSNLAVQLNIGMVRHCLSYVTLTIH